MISDDYNSRKHVKRINSSIFLNLNSFSKCRVQFQAFIYYLFYPLRYMLCPQFSQVTHEVSGEEGFPSVCHHSLCLSTPYVVITYDTEFDLQGIWVDKVLVEPNLVSEHVFFFLCNLFSVVVKFSQNP